MLLGTLQFDAKTPLLKIEQAGIDLEASSLLASSHSVGKLYIHCKRRKVTVNLTQL